MDVENRYQLQSPEDVELELAEKIRELRLAKNWKQSTLAERSGVSLASLRRFERMGLISLKSLLRLSFVLGRLSDFHAPLQSSKVRTIAELEAQISLSHPKRGAL